MRVLYAALALMLLGALWVTPVRVEARADLCRVPTLHAVCSVGPLRFAIDAVIDRDQAGTAVTVRLRGRKNKPGEPLRATLREVRDIFLFLRVSYRLRARLGALLRPESLSVSVRTGAGDAAHTALLYGLCCAGASALTYAARRKAGIRAHIRVTPDYRRPVFLCSADCIIAPRVGDIMGTALLAAMEILRAKRRAGNGK
jgi:hypothetical protein